MRSFIAATVMVATLIAVPAEPTGAIVGLACAANGTMATVNPVYDRYDDDGDLNWSVYGAWAMTFAISDCIPGGDPWGATGSFSASTLNYCGDATGSGSIGDDDFTFTWVGDLFVLDGDEVDGVIHIVSDRFNNEYCNDGADRFIVSPAYVTADVIPPVTTIPL